MLTLPQWLINLYNILIVMMDANGIHNPAVIALAIIIPIALAVGIKNNF